MYHYIRELTVLIYIYGGTVAVRSHKSADYPSFDQEMLTMPSVSLRLISMEDVNKHADRLILAKGGF
jgi:hypothetical protein